jgi:lipoprotein-releasing system ATP-binding protein
MNDLLIQAREIVKTYGEGEAATRVLKGVSLDFAKGSFAALVGASGSGKSTLLNILGTLLRPSSGDLEINGVPVTGMNDSQLSRFRNERLGFVFQFHHLLPDFSAFENVLFAAYGKSGEATSGDRDYAKELLLRVGLKDRLHHRPYQLSGGQKQRVAIARALMNRPALVLADEPTGNLDRAASEQAIGLIEEINRQDGTAFIICTHDMEIARRLPIMLKMVDGRLTEKSESGSPTPT